VCRTSLRACVLDDNFLREHHDESVLLKHLDKTVCHIFYLVMCGTAATSSRSANAAIFDAQLFGSRIEIDGASGTFQGARKS
jgi:hypothetical protein